MVTIMGYYYREKDGQAFALYEENGRRHLTNGIHDWDKGIDRRLSQLEYDASGSHIEQIFSLLKEYRPCSGLAAYFSGMVKGGDGHAEEKG